MEHSGPRERGRGLGLRGASLIGLALAGFGASAWLLWGERRDPAPDSGHTPTPIAPPPASTAQVHFDDFEFAQRLAEKGYPDFAKRVYERMLADPSLPAGNKDRAKYGMALLWREQAVAFAARIETTWADIRARYDAAAAAIEEYLNGNSKDAKADWGKIELGSLYLQIVTWINDHLNADESDLNKRDAAVDDFLKRRRTTKEVLYGDAQKFVEKAIARFDEVQKDSTKGGAASKDNRDMAAYQFATAQYYRGLVFPPCSPQAVDAFTAAMKTLETYAAANEDRLTGSFAMDFLGLTVWEIAKCETDAEKRTLAYQEALKWFQACTDIGNESIEHLRIITRGFYHLAQMSLEAGRQGGKDFWSDGSKDLARLDKVQQATNVPNGCRAYIEWAKIEKVNGRSAEAVRIATFASHAAHGNGFVEEERLANQLLKELSR